MWPAFHSQELSGLEPVAQLDGFNQRERTGVRHGVKRFDLRLVRAVLAVAIGARHPVLEAAESASI